MFIARLTLTVSQCGLILMVWNRKDMSKLFDKGGKQYSVIEFEPKRNDNEKIFVVHHYSGIASSTHIGNLNSKYA